MHLCQRSVSLKKNPLKSVSSSKATTMPDSSAFIISLAVKSNELVGVRISKRSNVIITIPKIKRPNTKPRDIFFKKVGSD